MDEMEGVERSVVEALPTDRLTRSDQLLTFFLDGQEYGVDILRVQEIRGWTETTAIPNQHRHMLGVINLRGTIVPIVDLRSRFNLDRVPFGMTTVVVVLNVEREGGEGRERVMGIVVDAVSDVYDVSDEDLAPAPEMGAGCDARFVRGIATVGDHLVIALDVDSLLDVEDFEAITAATPGESDRAVGAPDPTDEPGLVPTGGS